METTAKEGKYIYCIIESNQPQSFGPLGIGGRGDELRAIYFDEISAIVSNSPIIKYVASRENLLAHEKAIEKVMIKYPVLPVRFNTIAENEKEVNKILEKKHDKFKNLLNEIKDKKELGLKTMFKEDVIYQEILQKYEVIKKLKETIASKPPTQTYYQRVEIGRIVEQKLAIEKEKYKRLILEILKPLSNDLKLNNTYGERMIINAAFLIQKDKEADFDQRVQELDLKYGDKIKFKYIGTVPPFNFVNLTIETGAY